MVRAALATMMLVAAIKMSLLAVGVQDKHGDFSGCLPFVLVKPGTRIYIIGSLLRDVIPLATFAKPHGPGIRAHVHRPAVNTGYFREDHKDPEQHQADHRQKAGKQQDGEVKNKSRDHRDNGDNLGRHIKVIMAE